MGPIWALAVSALISAAPAKTPPAKKPGNDLPMPPPPAARPAPAPEAAPAAPATAPSPSDTASSFKSFGKPKFYAGMLVGPGFYLGETNQFNAGYTALK